MWTPTTNTQLERQRTNLGTTNTVTKIIVALHIDNAFRSKCTEMGKDAHTESMMATIKGRPEWRRWIMDRLWSLRAALF